jgi:Predicted hydrolase (metallo-beta-lactamase superfamily)
MKNVYKNIVSIILAASVVIGTFFLNTSMMSLAADAKQMEVHFIDVGQGDATLITCDGHSMLIDAGDDSKGTAIQNYLQKQKIQKLDYLILTHPDADHIGGAPVIITKFEINKVFVSNYEKDNKTYQKLIQALDNKRLKATTPKVGAKYYLGTAEIIILAPNKKYDDPNNASVCVLIKNGENRFLFTGDSEEKAEKDILDNQLDISANVYHAGHHGSRTSTSEEFFKAVKPVYAVISCGEGNFYGHPHAQTLNLFRTNGVEVFRTDEQGSIIAVSDGKEIVWNCSPSTTWIAGEPSDSSKSESIQEKTNETPVATTYICNINTKKFHYPSCSSVKQMSEKNKKTVTLSRDEVISQGYVPCKRCNP